MSNQQPKIIVIVGPTASGKSGLAVELAKKFGGEIVSADSRQVYKGMNIGTGKITEKEMADIPHHLLDVASPKRTFTVAQYQKMASRAVAKIIGNGKVPVICGGTGFYINALVDGLVVPEVKPNWRLRRELEKMDTKKLVSIINREDPRRAKNIDQKNRRRLTRAIEIIRALGRVPETTKKPPAWSVLMIGVEKDRAEIKKLIHKRLIKRIEEGMVEEVKKLHKKGVTWKRLEDFGLEYRFVGRFLRKRINEEQLVNELEKAIRDYAKRQLTWFRRDKRIRWVKSRKEAVRIAKVFLSV